MPTMLGAVLAGGVAHTAHAVDFYNIADEIGCDNFLLGIGAVGSSSSSGVCTVTSGTIPSGDIVNVASGNSLHTQFPGSMTNNGRIIIDSGGQLSIDGELINIGKIDVQSSGSIVSSHQWNSSGTIVVEGGGHADLGVFTNSGTFTNNGVVHVQNTFTNDGTYQNHGVTTTELCAVFDNNGILEGADVVDTCQPTVTVELPVDQEDPALYTPLRFTVTFNERVIGLDVTDVDLLIGGTVQATVQSVSGGPKMYTVIVEVSGGIGTVSVGVPSGGALDTAGNSNEASTSSDNTVAVNGPLGPRPAEPPIDDGGVDVPPTGGGMGAALLAIAFLSCGAALVFAGRRRSPHKMPSR